MNNKYINGAIIILAIVASFFIGMAVGGNTSQSLGASGTRFPNGISADTTSPIAGEVRGTTLTITDGVDITGAASVGTFTQGGGVLAISTSSDAYTLTQAQLSSYNVIDFTPLGDHATLTLPATSTLTTLLSTAGDYRQWVIRNGATAATNTTIAAGAGMDLQEPDGQNVVIGQTNYAWLTCYRLSSTDVACLVDESIPAD